MTITPTAPKVRYFKTNPECTGTRHSPRHDSYTHGCRCTGTIVAEKLYQADPDRLASGRRRKPESQDNPHCRAERHYPTQNGWNRGCRCSGAEAAHARWGHLRRERRERAAARLDAGLPACGAQVHNSLTAYYRDMCRCPGALLCYERHLARKREAGTDSDPRSHWRKGKMAVSRVNLWMLIHGFPDSPTTGERLAAVVHLSDVLVKDGPWRSRPMSRGEIAERIGCTDITVDRVRRMREELREKRTERRLADVRYRVRHTARGRKRRPRP